LKSNRRKLHCQFQSHFLPSLPLLQLQSQKEKEVSLMMIKMMISSKRRRRKSQKR
jgi:hypothetical protein